MQNQNAVLNMTGLLLILKTLVSDWTLVSHWSMDGHQSVTGQWSAMVHQSVMGQNQKGQMNDYCRVLILTL